MPGTVPDRYQGNCAQHLEKNLEQKTRTEIGKGKGTHASKPSWTRTARVSESYVAVIGQRSSYSWAARASSSHLALPLRRAPAAPWPQELEPPLQR